MGLVLTGYAVTVAATGSAGPDIGPSQALATSPGVRVQGPEPPQLVADAAGWIPRRVLVPSLGIDAQVLAIPTVGGVLVPPPDPQDLGWWSGGVRVGASHGSVLITGHTVHTGGGAMDHLGELAEGASVVVKTLDKDVEFRTVSVTYYPKQTLAAEAAVVFEQSGPHRLVLITCDHWNGTTYDGNTVVVALPIG